MQAQVRYLPVVEVPDMKKRSYEQNCTLALALDVIGDRWTLLIVRELLLGPKRYSELLKDLRGMGTNLLADRLKHLEEIGIVQRADGDEEASVKGYRLSATGQGLEEVVFAIVRWGAQMPFKFREGALSNPEWDIVAMRALFQPEHAADVDEIYQFEIEGFSYFVHVCNREIAIRTGVAEVPNLTVKTDRTTLSEMGRGASMTEALSDGRLALEGSPHSAERMVSMFSRSQAGAHSPG
ncbi:MAG: crotonobetainyl-CoA--carnitine CoA-transferase [unclassified Hahellaceae]|nr:crotonobetainyl-CoA--carnitine CoA-transferase [Hahellaceae bacterium]|tara:strand:- start:7399 stop:8112 length:714 start_codon:yes stop_codon:yes gene_type:complete